MKKTMKRIFIAIKIEPEEELKRIFSSFRSALGKERISWTNPANIHLTLVFLGETEEELLESASASLEESCSGFGEFRFTVRGTGLFRSISDPRVIWAGIEQCGKLNELQKKIASGLQSAGFSFDERPYKPHLTLGRIKSLPDPEVLKNVFEKFKDINIQEVKVREVILFESILKPTGPVYQVIGKFSLNPAP